MQALPDNQVHGKPRKNAAKTYIGVACRACGGTIRFIVSNKCVPCKRASARKFQNVHFNRYGSHLYKRLGITMTDYFAMAEAQEWKCKICNIIPKTRMHLDHCHKTMKVRGLLCGTCNKGLGQFRDNPEILEAAARYIRQC